MSTETTWLAEEDVEVTARKGVMFKEGTVVISVYDATGTGASGYLTRAQAGELADEIQRLVAGGDGDHAERNG